VADLQDPQGNEPSDNDPLDAGQGEKPDQSDDGDGLDGWPQEARDEVRRLRTEARRHRHAAREAGAKVKEYEDRDKSEEQRRQEELASATARAASAEARLLRFEVAAEHGIPQHAGRLQGDTREELVKDAQTLAKEFGVTGTGNGGGSPDFSSGVRRPAQRPRTMNDVIRQAAGR
jgi:hypothetical protein